MKLEGSVLEVPCTKMLIGTPYPGAYPFLRRRSKTDWNKSHASLHVETSNVTSHSTVCLFVLSFPNLPGFSLGIRTMTGFSENHFKTLNMKLPIMKNGFSFKSLNSLWRRNPCALNILPHITLLSVCQFLHIGRKKQRVVIKNRNESILREKGEEIFKIDDIIFTMNL